MITEKHIQQLADAAEIAGDALPITLLTRDAIICGSMIFNRDSFPAATARALLAAGLIRHFPGSADKDIYAMTPAGFDLLFCPRAA